MQKKFYLKFSFENLIIHSFCNTFSLQSIVVVTLVWLVVQIFVMKHSQDLWQKFLGYFLRERITKTDTEIMINTRNIDLQCIEHTIHTLSRVQKILKNKEIYVQQFLNSQKQDWSYITQDELEIWWCTLSKKKKYYGEIYHKVICLSDVIDKFLI